MHRNEASSGPPGANLVIPNDAMMSGRHAEIRLTTSRGQ
jgi:hypothetical protein